MSLNLNLQSQSLFSFVTPTTQKAVYDVSVLSPFTRMGFLWLVGPIKLQVSLTKEPYKRDDILQKRPIIESILLAVATQYLYIHSTVSMICTHNPPNLHFTRVCALDVSTG